jgi:hypothetical protein
VILFFERVLYCYANQGIFIIIFFVSIGGIHSHITFLIRFSLARVGGVQLSGNQVKINISLSDKTLASLYVQFGNLCPGWTLFWEEMLQFAMVIVGAGLSRSILLYVVLYHFIFLQFFSG